MQVGHEHVGLQHLLVVPHGQPGAALVPEHEVVLVGQAVTAVACSQPQQNGRPAVRSLVDRPDVDLLDVLNGGKPILGTYHRLPTTVTPALPRLS